MTKRTSIFVRSFLATGANHLVKKVAADVAAKGEGPIAHIARAGEGFLASQSERHLAEYLHHREKAPPGGPAHQLVSIIFDAVMQLFHQPGPTSSGPDESAVECFTRGIRAQRCGDIAVARYWLTHAADKGDRDAQRHLALLDGPKVALPLLGNGPNVQAVGDLARPRGLQPSMSNQPPAQPARGTTAWARSTLGIDEAANAQDIKAAYRALITRVHPDHGGDEDLTADLNLARKVLLG